MEVTRSELILRPDLSRVVAVPFLPHGPQTGTGDRIDDVAERLLRLTDAETDELVEQALQRFSHRHEDIEALWEEGFRAAAARSSMVARADGQRRRLLGAYFVREYAYEAAAVCNPSLVATDAVTADKPLPVVLSVRAIGEGHISSIAFRTGTIDPQGRLSLDARPPHSMIGKRTSSTYHKSTFLSKLEEIGVDHYLSRSFGSDLPTRFGIEALEAAITRFEHGDTPSLMAGEAVHLIRWLASSNYELRFGPGPVGQQVLTPAGPADSQGMEDARFVRFTEDDGEVRYYATYTAWDGHRVLPQLIETADFKVFRIQTLNGARARNKGMALFPRRLDGLYAALSRHDQESIFVMRSDQVRVWNNAEVVYTPREPWEAVQIGNCGSPIETEAGWLVVTHGVGSMRRYVLGALLLDLDDPTTILGRLREPLLEPVGTERDGYVPNVVYSCGGLVRAGRLILPYGISDGAVGFATFDLGELLAAMA